MAISLTLEWDKAQVAALSGDKLAKALTRAVRNSGDQAARQLVTQAVKYIRSRKNLKSGFIREALKLQRPGAGASLEDMAWNLRVRGKPVPLSQYPTRKGKGGVVARVNKGGSATLPGAFLANVGSGHRGVFIRKGKARLPIKQLFSSRVTDVLEDSGALDDLFRKAQARMAQAFTTQLDVQLAKLAR
jgi:hypothetical protein